MVFSTLRTKLNFCFQVSADFTTAANLVAQTLKYSIYSRQKKRLNRFITNPTAHIYRLKMKDKQFEIKMRFQDLFIFYEVFLYKTYQLPITWKVEKNTPTIVDLGGHIGLATLFFWLNYFPNGQFICVEASSKNLPLLKFNLTGVPCTILEGAIFYHEKGIRFTEDAMGYNHKIDTSSIGNTTPTFSMQGIVERFNIQKIHLAKIDIEGAEKYILQKNTDWLAKTAYFIVELHDDYSVSHLVEDTEKYNFQVLLPEKRNDIHMICGEKNW